jgi:VanZ family protein
VLRLAHAPAWIAASLLLLALVVWASLMPVPDVPGPPNFDKLEHVSAYALLAVWFTGLLPRNRYAALAVALLGLGVLMEFLQRAMQLGRQADVLDVAANVVGIGAGIAIALWRTGGWAPRVEAWLSRN